MLILCQFKIAAILIVIFNLSVNPGYAQSVPPQKSEPLLQEPLDLNKLPKPCFSENAVLPPPPLSQTEPSIPNLWLAKELYGGKLLKTWYIENTSVQISPNLYLDSPVTLIVNRESWNEERYLGQYAFVNHFGNVTRDYGYNLRVCNLQGDLLAYYICDYSTSPLECEVQIRSPGLRRRDFSG